MGRPITIRKPGDLPIFIINFVDFRVKGRRLMDWIKTYILAGVMLYSVNIFAQINTISTEKKVAENDSITKLNEVRVKGVGFLKEKEIKGQKFEHLFNDLLNG